MPLLSRTAVHTTFYALSILAIFCANPSAADATSIAPHRFPSISPITKCDSTCTHQEHADCVFARHHCHGVLTGPQCEFLFHECLRSCVPPVGSGTDVPVLPPPVLQPLSDSGK